MDLHLPNQILVDILLQLPIKEIIICKCTCKSWHAVISSPEFADLHFAQSKAFPIFRIWSPRNMSRICYVLEQEKLESYMNEFPCQRCIDSSTCMCIDDIKLDCKSKLPIRNFQLLSKVENGPVLPGNLQQKFKPKNHNYGILYSCNGFLCLLEPRGVPVVVCNPVTGDFLNLPEVYNKEGSSYIGCGFGFSPKSNEYKVVRIFMQLLPSELVPSFENNDPPRVDGTEIVSYSYSTWAQVHTLGSGSWGHIEFSRYIFSCEMMYFAIFLDVVIYWLCWDYSKNIFIVSFDCEKEIFRRLPSPPWSVSGRNINNMGMGTVGGCLCITSSKKSILTCWVMKDYGVEKSWSKVFEIDLLRCSTWPNGSYLPIKYMDNGALLMFVYPSTLVLYDQSKPDDEFRRFELYGSSGKFQMVVHTLSFVSLKDVLAGCDVEVLNVNSRYTKTKVPGEARAISLYEYRDPENPNVIEDTEGLADDLDNYL